MTDLGFAVPGLIARTTATEAATRALREIILSGAIPVGTPLRQDDVARRLGVSRTPLREALLRLEAEGLVRIDQHKGAVVAKPSIAEVSEIFELQSVLESLAGRHAVAGRTTADLADLRHILSRDIDIADPTAWEQANVEFHTRLYEISGRPLLVELIRQMRNRAGLYIHMLARSAERRERATREHWQMLAAVEAGDSKQLETLISHHLGTTLTWLKGVITE